MLIGFLLVAVARSCQITYQLSFSTCVFYVSYPKENSCTNFTLQQCQYQECISYSQNNGTQTCTAYATKYDDNWNHCTSTCCDPNIDYPQTTNSIQQCQQYLQSQFKKTLVIVCSVVGGVFLFAAVCICWVCYRKGKYRWLRFKQSCLGCLDAIQLCCCRERVERQQFPLQKPQYKVHFIEMKQKTTPVQEWQYPSVQDSKMKNVCSVCLDNGSSLQLQCSHAFHRSCIIACLKRKEQCILCRSTELNPAKIYCEVCLSAYYQLDLMDNLQQIQQNKQVCAACQETSLA